MTSAGHRIAAKASLVLVAFVVAACNSVPKIIGEIEYGIDAASQHVYVAFETSGNLRSQVIYGPGDAYNFSTTEQSGTKHYHVLSEVVPDTSYQMIVRAVDAQGKEIVSEELTFTTPPFVSPETLSSVSRASAARIAWNAAFGAHSYRIERAVHPDGPYTELATVSETNYVDRNVSGGEVYYYRITAIDAAGKAAPPAVPFRVEVSTAVIEDDFSTGFDDSAWAVYNHVSTGKSPVAVRDGKLVFENFHSNGWAENQGGIVFKEPINLVGKTTTVEVEYTEFGWTELNPGFFGELVLEGADIFDHNGFRLTVERENIDTRIAHGGDGSFSPSARWPAPGLPYTLKWVLVHLDGKRFAHRVYLNGTLTHEGEVHIGSIDPAALYFYLWVANNTDQGPRSAVNWVRVTQE